MTTEKIDLANIGLRILHDLDGQVRVSNYGGYVSLTGLHEAICFAMFGHPLTTIRRDYHTGWHYWEKLTSPAEEEKILRTVEKMEKKGYIKFSKSGRMVKPLMTEEEYYNKFKEEHKDELR